MFLRKPHSLGKNFRNAPLSFLPRTVLLTSRFRTAVAKQGDGRANLRRFRVDQPGFCGRSATFCCGESVHTEVGSYFGYAHFDVCFQSFCDFL